MYSFFRGYDARLQGANFISLCSKWTGGDLIIGNTWLKQLGDHIVDYQFLYLIFS